MKRTHGSQDAEEARLLNRPYVQIAWETIRSHIYGRVLDLGCGRGLQTRTHNLVVGVDVKIFPNPVVSPFVLASGAALPFKSETFDTVVLSHVLMYFDEPRLTLSEAKRVLKPFGIAIVHIPNSGAFTARVFRFLNRADRYPYVFAKHHKSQFDLSTLRSLLTETDLEIEEIIPTTLEFPAVSSLLNRAIPRASGRMGTIAPGSAKDLIALCRKKGTKPNDL